MNADAPRPELELLSAAAARLGLSAETLRAHLDAQGFPAFRIGRRLYTRPSEVAAALDAARITADAEQAGARSLSRPAGAAAFRSAGGLLDPSSGPAPQRTPTDARSTLAAELLRARRPRA